MDPDRAEADASTVMLSQCQAELDTLTVRVELLTAQLHAARFKAQAALQTSSDTREVARARDRFARDRDRLAREMESRRQDLEALRPSRWRRAKRALRSSGSDPLLVEAQDLEWLRGAFDGAWYLQINADVSQSQGDPWIHFLTFGRAEGRDPGPWFDSDWYLFRYPDVGNSGIVAFEHFLATGLAEGRFPNPRWESVGNSDDEQGRPHLRSLEDLIGLIRGELERRSEANVLDDREMSGIPLDALAWAYTVSARLTGQVGNALRILVDLQAVQGHARDRGLGRYSLRLARSLSVQPSVSGLDVLLNGGVAPEETLAARLAISLAIPNAPIHVFDAPWPWVDGDTLDVDRHGVPSLSVISSYVSWIRM